MALGTNSHIFNVRNAVASKLKVFLKTFPTTIQMTIIALEFMMEENLKVF